MADTNTESRLTPPIVEGGIPTARTISEGLDDTQSTPTDKPLTPAEIEKGLRATLEQENRALRDDIKIRDDANKRIAARRVAIAETERWLRAAQPRTRTPKKPNTGKPEK